MEAVRRPGKPPGALVELRCSRGERVYVLPGKLSELDIVVKYRQGASRLRTPKHIHWTVDMLLKKAARRDLANRLLDHFLRVWNETTPITTLQERESIAPRFLDYPPECNQLDECGYYSTEFLALLAELLMRQEKTNRRDAHMFRDVLWAMRTSSDLFTIISAATLRGGRRERA